MMEEQLRYIMLAYGGVYFINLLMLGNREKVDSLLTVALRCVVWYAMYCVTYYL